MHVDLTEAEVRAFQADYRAAHGIDISEQEARQTLTRVISLIAIVYNLDL